MPPPPCEEFVIPSPSMLEGLHRKLLGSGEVVLLQSALLSNTVPVGKAPAVASPAPTMLLAPAGSFTPLASTVMPAPSRAPISAGSCRGSARLPFCEASQPRMASIASRSTCGSMEPSGLCGIGRRLVHPFSVGPKTDPALQSYLPDGSYTGCLVSGKYPV